MADIKNELIKINNVIVYKTVADAFLELQKFVKGDKSITLTIKPNGGYMSKYRLVEELAKLTRTTPETPTNIKDLLEEAKNPESFKVLAADTAKFSSLETYINGLKNSNFDGDEFIMTKYKVSQNHPYLTQGQFVYGIPNTTTTDPRRSGYFLNLDVTSDDLYKYLLKTAPSYGFIWYGVSKGYWLFDSNVKAKGPSIIESISNNVSSTISDFFDFI